MAPPKARAVCGCNVGSYQTAIYPGAGPSCNSAFNAWYNQAITAADASCPYGACNVGVVTTTACYWDSSVGAYRESGKLTYKCNLWCP